MNLAAGSGLLDDGALCVALWAPILIWFSNAAEWYMILENDKGGLPTLCAMSLSTSKAG